LTLRAACCGRQYLPKRCWITPFNVATLLALASKF
jgi:hypothetical protein